MALYADRVKDSTSITGTGAITLSGTASAGYQTFATAFGASPQTVAYCIADQSGSKWEVGTGVFNGTTGLTRVTVLASSSGGSLVAFTGGTQDVFCTAPAKYLDTFTSTNQGVVPASGGGTTTFLRADGSFAAPPTTAPAGATTQIQYNNAGAFGANANFFYTSGTNTVSFGNLTGSALAMTIQPLAPTSVQDAGILAITTQNAVKANSTGGRLTVNTGTGTGTAAGGHLWAQTGASATGFSGDVFVSTYNATTPSKSGAICFKTNAAPFALSDGRIQFENLFGALSLASFGIECFLLSDPVFGTGLPILFTAGNNSVAGEPGGRVSFSAGSDSIGGSPGGDIAFRPGNGSPSGAVRIASYSNGSSNLENIVVYDDASLNSITRFYGGVNTSGVQVIEVFGEASSGLDKLAFFGVAPVAQPTTATTAATRAAVIGTVANVGDTYDGYTLAKVVKALRNLGILA
jgi:hypothetical protein